MSCCCFPNIFQIITSIVIFILLKKIYDFIFGSKTEKTPPKILKSDWKKDVVYLYQFPRAPFLPNLSPFCLKLETFLRVNKIQYEVMPTVSGRSHKGLLPFIELNGEHIADSQLIILHLQKYFNIGDTLTDDEKILERSFDRMLDGSTFYCCNYLKFIGHWLDFGTMAVKINFGPKFNFLKYPIAAFFRYNVMKRLINEGTGRHTQEEVLKIFRSDLKAIEDSLDGKTYILGDKPCLADCTIFGHLAAIYYLPYRHLGQDIIKEEFPKVLGLVERIGKEFYDDFKLVNKFLLFEK